MEERTVRVQFLQKDTRPGQHPGQIDYDGETYRVGEAHVIRVPAAEMQGLVQNDIYDPADEEGARLVTFVETLVDGFQYDTKSSELVLVRFQYVAHGMAGVLGGAKRLTPAEFRAKRHGRYVLGTAHKYVHAWPEKVAGAWMLRPAKDESDSDNSDADCIPRALLEGFKGTVLRTAYGSGVKFEAVPFSSTAEVRAACGIAHHDAVSLEDIEGFLDVHGLAVTVLDDDEIVRWKHDGRPNVFSRTSGNGPLSKGANHLFWLSHDCHIFPFDVDRAALSFKKFPVEMDAAAAAKVAEGAAIKDVILHIPQPETSFKYTITSLNDIDAILADAIDVDEGLGMGHFARWKTDNTERWFVGVKLEVPPYDAYQNDRTMEEVYKYWRDVHRYEARARLDERGDIKTVHVLLCRSMTPEEMDKRVGAAKADRARRGYLVFSRVDDELYPPGGTPFSKFRDDWVDALMRPELRSRSRLNRDTARIFSSAFARGQLVRRVAGAEEWATEQTENEVVATDGQQRVFQIDATRMFTHLVFTTIASTGLPTFYDEDAFKPYARYAADDPTLSTLQHDNRWPRINDHAIYIVNFSSTKRKEVRGMAAWKAFQWMLLLDKEHSALYGVTIKGALARLGIDFRPLIDRFIEPGSHTLPATRDAIRDLVGDVYATGTDVQAKFVVNSQVGTWGRREIARIGTYVTTDVAEAFDRGAYHASRGAKTRVVELPDLAAADTTVYALKVEKPLATFRDCWSPWQHMVHDLARLEMACGIQRLSDTVGGAAMPQWFAGIRADAILLLQNPAKLLKMRGASDWLLPHDTATTLAHLAGGHVLFKIVKGKKVLPGKVMSVLLDGGTEEDLPAKNEVVPVAPVVSGGYVPYFGAGVPKPAPNIFRQEVPRLKTEPLRVIRVVDGEDQDSKFKMFGPGSLTAQRLKIFVHGWAGAGKTRVSLRDAPKNGRVTVLTLMHARRLGIEEKHRWTQPTPTDPTATATFATRTLASVKVAKKKGTWRPRSDEIVVIDEVAMMPDDDIDWILADMRSHPDTAYILNGDFGQNVMETRTGVDPQRRQKWESKLASELDVWIALDRNLRLVHASDRCVHADLRRAWDKMQQPALANVATRDPRDVLWALHDPDHNGVFRCAHDLKELMASDVRVLVSQDNASAFVYNDMRVPADERGMAVICRKDGVRGEYKKEISRKVGPLVVGVEGLLLNYGRYVVMGKTSYGGKAYYQLEIQLKSGSEILWFECDFFRPAFASTCHAAQGDDYDFPYAVDLGFAWNPYKPDASKIPFMYTAITRGLRFKDVVLYTGEPIGQRLSSYVKACKEVAGVDFDPMDQMKDCNACCSECLERLGVLPSTTPSRRPVFTVEKTQKTWKAKWFHAACAPPNDTASKMTEDMWRRIMRDESPEQAAWTDPVDGDDVHEEPVAKRQKTDG